MKKVDAFLATAIFGSAQFDEPEVLDDVVGDEVDDQLQQLFDSFFDRAALERLQLCKSDSLAKTSSLAKAGIPRKFGIARVETREIDNTIWAVAFDADGNLVDQQEIGPGPLGKRTRISAGTTKSAAARVLKNARRSHESTNP
jgi:hypothetical protein